MEKTMSTLLQFVEASTNQGIYNRNTGSSRVSTIRKIIYGLNLANTDIDDVDANELWHATRINFRKIEVSFIEYLSDTSC